MPCALAYATNNSCWQCVRALIAAPSICKNCHAGGFVDVHPLLGPPHGNVSVLSLQAQEEQIMTDFGPEDERLEGIYERMEELDPTKFEVEAAKLLHGLGFDKAMMAKGTKDMSGRHVKPAAALCVPLSSFSTLP